MHVSLPHFLHADPEIADAVKDLNPNEDEHVTCLDVAPFLSYSFQEENKSLYLYTINIRALLNINLSSSFQGVNVTS